MTRKKKRNICIVSILAAVIITFVLFGSNITNAVISITMGRNLPQLSGKPEVGKWYTVPSALMEANGRDISEKEARTKSFCIFMAAASV